MKEMRVWSLGQEDDLEKEMATHSRILAWEIPWTEEPGGLRSMGSQKSQTRLSDWTTIYAKAVSTTGMSVGGTGRRMGLSSILKLSEWDSEEVTFKQRPLCPFPHHCCFSKINAGVTSHPALLNFLRPTGLTSSKVVVTSVCVWLLLIKGFFFLNFTSSLYH